MMSTRDHLLSSTAAGDEASFARLYDDTAARVHGLVLRVVRDPAQAEEVTQEVFLDVWRTASRFDPRRGSAMSWVLTVAHRKAVDRVRSAEASSRRDTVDHRGTVDVLSDETADAVETSRRAGAVRDALTLLSAEQREAIVLAYFGGHTHAEASRLLRIPLGTAKSRIRDGLLRLREELGSGSLEIA